MTINAPLHTKLYADIEFINFGEFLQRQLDEYNKKYKNTYGPKISPLGTFKPTIVLDKNHKAITLKSSRYGIEYLRLHFETKKIAELAFDILNQEKALWNFLLGLSTQYEKYLREQLSLLYKWKYPEKRGDDVNED